MSRESISCHSAGRTLVSQPSSKPAVTDALEGFWVALSFVPDDLEWCDWLFRELHNHSVPILLAAQTTHHGFPLPQRITVFPDRLDPDHFEKYPAALATARYLLVVCSPSSAHARQVDEQIRAFKRAGGEDRIIALVVEREPHAGQEKWPKTYDGSWLPAWLRWRLGEDGRFAAAGPEEPLIVDARPGHASLEDVKLSLFSALLDVESAQIDELEHAEPPSQPARHLIAATPRPQPITIQRETVAPPASAPLIANPIEHRDVRRPWQSLGIPGCVALSIAAFWLASGSAHLPEPTHAAATLGVTLTPASTPNAEVIAVAHRFEPVPEPDAPVAPIQRGAAHDETDAQSPGEQPLALEPLGPPAPTAAELAAMEEAKMCEEKDVLIATGDRLVDEGNLSEALDYYAKAVRSAQRYSTRRGEPAVLAEVAMLHRKLGTLQSHLASTAEARETFLRGRKILSQLKARGQWNKERGRTLEDLDESLRKLPRD